MYKICDFLYEMKRATGEENMKFREFREGGQGRGGVVIRFAPSQKRLPRDSTKYPG